MLLDLNSLQILFFLRGFNIFRNLENWNHLAHTWLYWIVGNLFLWYWTWFCNSWWFSILWNWRRDTHLWTSKCYNRWGNVLESLPFNQRKWVNSVGWRKINFSRSSQSSNRSTGIILRIEWCVQWHWELVWRIVFVLITDLASGSFMNSEPPDWVDWVTLNSLLLNPGTYNTSSKIHQMWKVCLYVNNLNQRSQFLCCFHNISIWNFN